jgi:hypothetical protein
MAQTIRRRITVIRTVVSLPGKKNTGKNNIKYSSTPIENPRGMSRAAQRQQKCNKQKRDDDSPTDNGKADKRADDTYTYHK